ncbi:hypothetical protein MAR_007894 [Mya arenaria]|uniref:Uncharacterized protein n=1 Tax=Mya arenaria TaxID=6604 RepID=A0ABY7DYG5_MYAAR|nr:hypothetical protein MAR_007894 [Mya arenaria]
MSEMVNKPKIALTLLNNVRDGEQPVDSADYHRVIAGTDAEGRNVTSVEGDAAAAEHLYVSISCKTFFKDDVL